RSEEQTLTRQAETSHDPHDKRETTLIYDFIDGPTAVCCSVLSRYRFALSDFLLVRTVGGTAVHLSAREKCATNERYRHLFQIHYSEPTKLYPLREQAALSPTPIS
ncbi:unnamed protein product, partial [Ectocarpus fasciculatus]